MELAFAAPFGLMIGSFLNVVAYRLPRGESLVAPASHCPGCETPIRPWDNIPLLSWIFLRGRCRSCGQRISARYPLVELLTGVLFAVVAAVHGLDAELAVELPFVAMVIAVADIDLEHRVVPNKILLPLAVWGVAGSAVVRTGALPELLIAGAGAFTFLLVAALIHPAGMGMGDVKLAGVMGLDLDGAFIAAVHTSSDGVTRAASVELAPGVISDGEVTDVAALTEALRDFFKAEALPKRVRLGIGNQQIVVRQLEIPKIDDDKERAAAVRFQASEAIAMPLDEVVLDHQVVGEAVSPEGSARLRVVVGAARESMIARIIEAVRAAGLRPEGIDLNAFALVRTLAVPSDSTETARVFCHLGGVTNLAIAVGTTCLFTRPLSTQWDSDDDNVASALAEEIRLSIDFYIAPPEGRRVGEIVLSGPGSRRAGLADELSGLIEVPVTVAEPLGRLHTRKLPLHEDPYPHT